MSNVLLMCPSIRFVCILIDKLIHQSINRWIFMSLIWNRHTPSSSPIYLCLLIGVSTYLLINWSGNQRMRKLTLLSNVNARPSKRVSVSRLLSSETNQTINRSQCWSECVRLSNQVIPMPLNNDTTTLRSRLDDIPYYSNMRIQLHSTQECHRRKKITNIVCLKGYYSIAKATKN